MDDDEGAARCRGGRWAGAALAALAAAMVLGSSERAGADACSDLRAEIARLERTLANEQRALQQCSNHLGTCTPGQINGIQEAIRATQRELAADRLQLPGTCAPPSAPRAPAFSIVDVSPDRPFGDTGGGNTDPAGRVMAIVIDPRNADLVYAASEFAGIWKSTDAAHSWKQASAGLTTGESATTPTLAIDETDPRRLAFASGNDDYRPSNPSGGIWISLDGARSWRHATIAGCRAALAYRVAFAGGHGYAVTSCGLATSNATDMASWTLLTTPFSVGSGTYVAARDQVVFACAGATVERGAWTAAGGSAPKFAWTESATLPGACDGIAAAPSTTRGEPLAMAIHASGPAIDVSSVVFRGAAPKVTSFRFPARRPPANLGNRRGRFCCGADGVFVAPRQGDASRFDVFASDGYAFYAYVPRTSDLPATWSTIAGVHADTWSMAFPAAYDPGGGNCTAYTASDGGVHVSLASAPGRICRTAAGPWALAQSGLHAFGASSIVGVPQPSCGSPAHNCSAIYLSGSDNATWFSPSGGLPGASWSAMPCCGDTGSATIDWAAPGLVVLNRNGVRQQFQSSDGKPPTPAAANKNLAADRPDLIERSEPPQQASFVQVITRTAEASANPHPAGLDSGDYFNLSSPAGGDDTVVRTTDAATWVDIAPKHHLKAGTLNAIATAGGHRDPTVYVVTSAGALQRRRANDPAADWQDASGLASDPARLVRVEDVWVNPDDARQLYVTDSGAGAIKSSSDGGLHWRVETELGRIATHDGEYRFGCFNGLGAGRRFCSLQQVLFVRDQPALRVAILFPGAVAISRDAGVTWRAIGSLAGSARSLRDLVAYAYAGYVDVAADHRQFSLYLALRGRGAVRIDGAF